MTKSPSGHGNNLAADLLADLARPLALARQPASSVPPTAFEPARSGAADETHARRPALEGSLRISPLDWRKPSLTLGRLAATVRFGALRAELGIRFG
jgi:hypothetical protein